jgi:Ca2+-transporting ATPase
MGVEELAAVVDAVAVYARVAPEHKLTIVAALQRRGHVVAMTGDGVNDAPALKKADIGVAMGLTGTDVAKEAADMVLLDDNFATVVAAVEEGRAIYGNVRKFVRYLMATNAGELWLMLLAPLAGLPLPLLPLQILWVNLVTDGPAALALAVEPPEPGAMRRPPHRPGESILARGLGRHVLWVGLLMALLAGGVGYAYWAAGSARWQTMVFTVVVLAQMAHVLAIRSERESLFTIGVRSNPSLLGAVAVAVVLQVALVYWAPARALFGTVPLSAPDLALAVALSSAIFWAVELEKWLGRRREAAPALSQPRPR